MAFLKVGYGSETLCSSVQEEARVLVPGMHASGGSTAPSASALFANGTHTGAQDSDLPPSLGDGREPFLR